MFDDTDLRVSDLNMTSYVFLSRNPFPKPDLYSLFLFLKPSEVTLSCADVQKERCPAVHGGHSPAHELGSTLSCDSESRHRSRERGSLGVCWSTKSGIVRNEKSLKTLEISHQSKTYNQQSPLQPRGRLRQGSRALTLIQCHVSMKSGAVRSFQSEPRG